MDTTAPVAELAERLSGAPNPDLASDLQRRVDVVRLASGERLFMQGDESDAAYFLIGGRVAVSAGSGEGPETLLSVFGRGEIVGEMGLLHTAPRSATVTAIRPATLLRLSASDFEELVSAHPRLLRTITTAVLDRLQSGGHSAPLAGTIAVATAPGLDAAAHLEVLADEIGRFGSLHVGRPLDVPRQEAARLLDDAEATHRHVLIDAGPGHTPWAEEALTRADRVLVFVDRATHGFGSDVFGRIGETPYVAKWLAVVHSTAIEPGGGALAAARAAPDVVVNLRRGSGDDLRRVARLASGHGTGLVLGGGGARALGHIGALRALEESGIVVDAVSGASMGAIVAASIAQGETSASLTKIAPVAFSSLLDRTYPAVSLYSGRRVVAALESRFGTWAFEDLLLPLFVTSVNLTASELEVHGTGALVHALRASTAIPGLFPPVPKNGDLLVDGGLLDNLPIDALRTTGMVDRVIAVDVAPPLGPRAKTDFGLSVSGWRAWRSGRHPRISAVLMRSMLVGAMRSRDAGISEGAADLYLDLDLRGVPLLDFGDIGSIIERGYAAASPRVADWSSDVEVPGRLAETEA